MAKDKSSRQVVSFDEKRGSGVYQALYEATFGEAKNSDELWIERTVEQMQLAAERTRSENRE